MALKTLPEIFEKDLTCPICQEIFTDPVTLKCGHNFCWKCVCDYWETLNNQSCPICRALGSKTELHINITLLSITDSFKKKPKARPKGMCSEHEEKLKLFCLEDQDLICVVCQTSKRHQKHKCCPIKEAALEYKKEVKMALTPLQDTGKTFTKVLEECDKHLKDILDQTDKTEKQIKEDFVKLHRFLHEEEKNMLADLKKEKEEKEQKVREKIKSISEEMTSLLNNIKEIEKKLDQEDNLFLMQQRMPCLNGHGVNPGELRDWVQRCVWLFGNTNTALLAELCHSFLLKLNPQAVDLAHKDFGPEAQGTVSGKPFLQELVRMVKTFSSLDCASTALRKTMMQRIFARAGGNRGPLSGHEFFRPIRGASRGGARGSFRGSRGSPSRGASSVPKGCGAAVSESSRHKKEHLQLYKHFSLVPVTLDPNTAHSTLTLSEDLTTVTCGSTRKKLPNTPERFDKCVSVLGSQGFSSGRHSWVVDVGNKTDWSLGVAEESANRKGQVYLAPENGYWTIILRDGDTYSACTNRRIRLELENRPKKLLVSLDYEAGKVLFYNADDMSRIFTFRHNFTQKLFPYFSPCTNTDNKNGDPMQICPL
ncbi:nuclear factor 7, brain-like [Latimeria chalumnae]|uniref:nuclear factor 7, brain-like n=1 Tax=Latimeria chalumnae TaxID=7897 RepID=UPI00313E2944